MNEEAKIPMDEFNKLSKAQQIRTLCDYHECSKLDRKQHYRQYKRGWNPHPPHEFSQWWPAIGWKQTEIVTERAWKGVSIEDAFNCEVVRVVYREGKQMGTLWDDPPFTIDTDRHLLPLERLKKIKELIKNIDKPMPKPKPFDRDPSNEPIEF